MNETTQGKFAKAAQRVRGATLSVRTDGASAALCVNASPHSGDAGQLEYVRPPRSRHAHDPAETERLVFHFLERLAAAASIFQAEGDGGRKGARQAVRAVALFLADLSCSGRLQNPRFRSVEATIIALYQALVDLDNGAIAPMLKHREFGNRAPDGAATVAARAKCAAATYLLMEVGMGRKEAATAVANRIKGSFILKNIKRDDWLAVDRWRYDRIKDAKGQTLPQRNDGNWPSLLRQIMTEPPSALREFKMAIVSAYARVDLAAYARPDDDPMSDAEVTRLLKGQAFGLVSNVPLLAK